MFPSLRFRDALLHSSRCVRAPRHFSSRLQCTNIQLNATTVPLFMGLTMATEHRAQKCAAASMEWEEEELTRENEALQDFCSHSGSKCSCEHQNQISLAPFKYDVALTSNKNNSHHRV